MSEISSSRSRSDKYAVVRASRSIPGGLRIVGTPTQDEAQARRIAAEKKRPHEVLPLAEVYRRRGIALGLVCPHCDGRGNVHHGEGALHFITPCRDPECLARREREWAAECGETDDPKGTTNA